MQKKIQDEVLTNELNKNNNSIMMSEGLSDIVDFNDEKKVKTTSIEKELFGKVKTESSEICGVVLSGLRSDKTFRYKILVTKNDIVTIESELIQSFCLFFNKKYINTWERSFFNISYSWENIFNKDFYNLEITITTGDKNGI